MINIRIFAFQTLVGGYSDSCVGMKRGFPIDPLLFHNSELPLFSCNVTGFFSQGSEGHCVSACVSHTDCMLVSSLEGITEQVVLLVLPHTLYVKRSQWCPWRNGWETLSCLKADIVSQSYTNSWNIYPQKCFWRIKFIPMFWLICGHDKCMYTHRQPAQ